MSRMVDLDDIMTAEQIADYFGITRQGVDLWTRKATFPEPIRAANTTGRLWLLPEVVAWRAAQPPPRVPKQHGTPYRYRMGCRCDICRAANAEKTRKYSHGHDGLPPGDQRHGTAYAYRMWRCRCQPCVAANSAESRAYREARKP